MIGKQRQFKAKCTAFVPLCHCDGCGRVATKEHPAASYGNRNYCATCINKMADAPLSAWQAEIRNEGEKKALERWRQIKAWAKAQE